MPISDGSNMTETLNPGPPSVATDYHPNLPRIFYSRVGNQTLRTAIWKGVDKGHGKRTPLLFFNGIGANLEDRKSVV